MIIYGDLKCLMHWHLLNLSICINWYNSFESKDSSVFYFEFLNCVGGLMLNGSYDQINGLAPVWFWEVKICVVLLLMFFSEVLLICGFLVDTVKK